MTELAEPPLTCDRCRPWVARSQEQADNRLRNMAAAPHVQTYACPQCGSTDWATAMIEADGSIIFLKPDK